MQLDEFIAGTIVAVLSGIKQATQRLENDALGSVWTQDFNTLATDLVGVRLLKGKTENQTSSVPVLILDYDVKVIVEAKAESKEGIKAGVGFSWLKVLTVDTQATLHKDKSHTASSVHNLKFAIPVALPEK